MLSGWATERVQASTSIVIATGTATSLNSAVSLPLTDHYDEGEQPLVSYEEAINRVDEGASATFTNASGAPSSNAPQPKDLASDVPKASKGFPFRTTPNAMMRVSVQWDLSQKAVLILDSTKCGHLLSVSIRRDPLSSTDPECK